MMYLLPNAKIGAPWLGIVIPAVILIISIFLTWFLYRRFSAPADGEHPDGNPD